MDAKKKKEFDLEFSKEQGIVDNISYRDDTYPDKFYQVLEALDLVMRCHTGEKMGTSGYDELLMLCATIKTNGMLAYCMPKSAKSFFQVLVNPTHSFSIFKDSGNGYGAMNRAYADLRQYLIDNKELVAEAHNKFLETIIYKKD